MDDCRLVTIVREYEEIYNSNHPQYGDLYRRDNIWEVIGQRMNQPGKVCRDRWSRIRENFRKSLNRRLARGGQASARFKPLRFEKELSFLTPFMHEDDDWQLSSQTDERISDEDTYEEEQVKPFILPTPSPSGQSFPEPKPAESSSDYSRPAKKQKLDQPEPEDSGPSPLVDFFLTMARTVKRFPLKDQLEVKAQLFRIVYDIEMRIVCESEKLSEGNG